MRLLTPPGRVVGALPLFRQLAQDIGLVEAINQTVHWDARLGHLSPGKRLLVLVLDILGGKSPLYRMVERWAVTDVPMSVQSLGYQATNFPTFIVRIGEPDLIALGMLDFDYDSVTLPFIKDAGFFVRRKN